MKDQEIEYLSLDILNEIMVRIKTMAPSIDIRLYQDEYQNSIECDHFILAFVKNKGNFALSFKIHTFCCDVALYMIEICQVLTYNELIIYEDYFITDNSIVYGNEAIEAKQKYILNNNGYDKCPACNMIYTLDKITENKLCSNCSTNNSIVWH